MASVNKKTATTSQPDTGKTLNMSPIQELRRTVLTTMLFEKNGFESGESVTKRIDALSSKVDIAELVALVDEARNQFNLRHVSLYLALKIIQHKDGARYVRQVLNTVIRRADEMGEIIAMYQMNGRRPLSSQMKLGLADAFKKFDEYQLAKYNRSSANYKIRDVMRLVHPKPSNDEQAKLWGRVIADELKTPDTWEVALSGGANKKDTFERLIKDGKLPYMALIRNLRNMVDSKCDTKLINDAIINGKGKGKLFPYRFMSALKTAPLFKDSLQSAMFESLSNYSKMPGKTVFVVDLSGSMDWKLSEKSEASRRDVALSLAIMFNEVCSDSHIVWAANTAMNATPGVTGFDLIADAKTANKTIGGGTTMSEWIKFVEKHHSDADRVVVLTDEQDNYNRHITLNAPGKKSNYMINLVATTTGVDYFSDWVRVNGWSETIIEYISFFEQMMA